MKEIVKTPLNFLVENGMKAILANPKIGDDLLDLNLKNWEKHYAPAQLNLLIESPFYEEGFSIFKAQEYFDMLNAPDEPGPNNCSCRYNVSCGLVGGYCDWEVKCTQVAQCGVFGGSACKGKCK